MALWPAQLCGLHICLAPVLTYCAFHPCAQVLLKLIQPYTRVRLPFISHALHIPEGDVERLLVSLILDNRIEGYVDQVGTEALRKSATGSPHWAGQQARSFYGAPFNAAKTLPVLFGIARHWPMLISSGHGHASKLYSMLIGNHI